MTFKTWCITSTQGDAVIAYCGGGDVIPGVPVSVCHNATIAKLTLDLAAFADDREFKSARSRFQRSS